MHRYGRSRVWSVALLAAFASAGVTLLTGAVVTALPPPGVEVEAPRPAVVPGPPVAAPAAAPEAWRIQVGAFATRQAAEAQLRALSGSIPALAGSEPSIVPAGPLTRARFGGLPDRASAAELCARVVEAGSDCVVVPPV